MILPNSGVAKKNWWLFIVDFKEINHLIYAEFYVLGDLLKLHEASLATLKPV